MLQTGYGQQASPKPQPDKRLAETAQQFRKRLAVNENARKLQIEQFLKLRRNAGIKRSYSDAKGTFYFLHHIDSATGEPVYYQTRSNVGLAGSIKTDKLWRGGSLGLDLQGQGMEVSSTRSRLGMWEPGAARISHVELRDRAFTRDIPVFTAASENADHATHVAGTMMGAGVNPLARGMANQARLDCYEIQTNETEEIEAAASQGMLVSNHSYGPSFDNSRVKLGVYDEAAQMYDELAYRNKNYLMFHAAGNDRDDEKDIRYDILIGGALSKNVAAVGAVKRFTGGGYTGPSSVSIADFSSFGPADDGRIKPDFVAPGVAILSAYSASDTTYKSIDGTSMASPGAAGSLFLLQQHHRNVKSTFMRSATLKGLGIHTADEAGPNPGPDYMFGWGLLNLERAIEVINLKNGLHLMEEAQLANEATYRKNIQTGGGPFKATICWTDVPGTPLVNGGRDNRKAMLVNDLDLRLLNAATNQSVAELPWKLDPARPADAAVRGDNTVDNIEQISIDNLPAGNYVLQVTHKGSLQQGPQEFSVFISGLGTVPVIAASSPDPVAGEDRSAPEQQKNSFVNKAALDTADSDPGIIVLERSSTNGPLVVYYHLEGSAENGVDFVALPGSVTFADGQSRVEIEILPVDDNVEEADEEVILVIDDRPEYDPDPEKGRTGVTIKENAVPQLPAALTITSFTCNGSTSETLNRVDFVVGYANGAVTPALPPLFINGVTANGQLGVRYSLPFDQNQFRLTVQDQATRSTYFTWDFRQACLTTPPSGTTAPPSTGNCATQSGTIGMPLGIAGVTAINCQTGSFRILTTGGNGSAIDFSNAVGLSNADPTSCLRRVDGPDLVKAINNPASDVQPFRLRAVQGSQMATYSFNFKAACSGSARVGTPESTADWQLTVENNPVGNELAILIEGASGQQYQMELLDLNGRPIAKRRIQPSRTRHREVFDLSAVPSGLFILRINDNHTVKTRKILKQ